MKRIRGGSKNPNSEATSDSNQTKPEVPPTADLFLNEDALVMLAIRELKGKRPPIFDEFGNLQGTKRAPARRYFPKNLLARELEARGWTARELAQKCDMSHNEIAALAKGNTKITPQQARILAKAFATSEDFWLEGM